MVIELRQRHPLMPFSIFRLRTLRGANIVGLLIGMSLFSMFFFISLYLQDVLHYSPIKAGLSYLPLSVAIILSAATSSQLVTRVGFKPPLIAGMLLSPAACCGSRKYQRQAARSLRTSSARHCSPEPGSDRRSCP